MYTPQFPLPGQKAGYGLGVNSRPYHGATLLFHGGGGYGYSTDQRWVPEYKVGVVILSNGDGGDNFVADLAERAMTGLIRAKQGQLPPNAPHPWEREPVITPEVEELRRLEGKLLRRGSVDRLRGGRATGSTSSGGIGTNPLIPSPRPASGRAANCTSFCSTTRADPRRAESRGQWRQLPGLERIPSRSSWPGQAGMVPVCRGLPRETYGLDNETPVVLKNGNLYWNDRLKLREYRSGFFFTADGDSVRFGQDTVDYGNRHFRRVN